jgi:glycosyltransferase involved in cell wall biosynthesis
LIRLGLDLNCLTAKKRTGIGVYATHLTRELLKNPELSVQGFGKITRANKLKTIRSHLGMDVKIYGPLEHFGLNKLDVYHGLDFRVPRTSKFKKIVTVHDLCVFENIYNSEEDVRIGKMNFTHMLEVCKPDHILTVSEYSRQRLIHFFPQYEKKSSAIYLGADHRVIPSGSVPNELGDYILFVGTVEKRKNVFNLIPAFEIVKKKFSELKLVIVGGQGFEAEKVLALIEKSPHRESILYYNYIDDQKLNALYKNALLFCFPTLYEGFGIPVIEAMKFGLPVVTSNTGAINEVAGDAAYKVAPESPDAIAEGISRVVSDSNLRQDLKARGLAKAAGYTWARCARENFELYKLFSQS